MSYEFYKIMHFFGIFMVISALGGQCVLALNGHDVKGRPGRLWTAILHGVGLLLVLVGGFGLLARIGAIAGGFPDWAAAKLVIWVLLGGISALISRKKGLAGPIWIAILLLATLAGYLARSKML